MLGQPVSMLIPEVVGFKLTGANGRRHHRHRPCAQSRAECCARMAWFGKFVEFYGEGLDQLPLADRATIAKYGPRIPRRNLRFLPRLTMKPCATCAPRAGMRTRVGRSSKPMQKEKRLLARGGLRRRSTPPRWSWTWAAGCCLPFPGPKRPQDHTLRWTKKRSQQSILGRGVGISRRCRR